jgi:ribosomal 30S subunit maturation factor RimM
VVITLTTNLVEPRTAVGATFDAGGETLTVVAARPHGPKWLVRFAGFDDRDRADTLRGRTLRAEPTPLANPAGPADPEAEHGTEVVALVHELIGSRLIDQHGTDHGPIRSVVDNPASDLLELSDGRLVPLAFYRSHDSSAGIVEVEVPIGLLDDGAVSERD